MTDTISVLIVDDEPLAIERMVSLCRETAGLVIAGTAANGAIALQVVEALQPDLILLDISMPEMDGLSVAKTLSKNKRQPAIIFVTAFDNFAVEAFDTSAVDYLLKPVSRDRLERGIERAQKLISVLAKERGKPKEPGNHVPEFWVPHRSELIRISSGEISRIEAERDYMRLFVGSRSYLLHETISALESKLDPAIFVRIHRSVIVRQDMIARLGHDGAGMWHIELVDGSSHRVGRTYLRRVKALAGR